MNAPFDPKKAIPTPVIPEELAKEYLSEAQCYLAALSGMLLQVQTSNAHGNLKHGSSFKAFLSACESLAIMSLRKIDKLGLNSADALEIREKVYGLAIAIKEASLFNIEGNQMDEALYGLHYLAKHLQFESNDAIWHLINTKY